MRDARTPPVRSMMLMTVAAPNRADHSTSPVCMYPTRKAVENESPAPVVSMTFPV
jgi:hypothetical protein